MKKIYVSFSAIIFFCATIVLSGYCLNKSPQDLSGVELFEVYSGDSGYDVAYNLGKMGFIKSEAFFSFILRVKKGTIKAGTYKIPLNADSLSIYDILVSGKQEYVKLTIPEGLTISKIAALLETHEITSSENFIMAAHDPAVLQQYHIQGDSAEGYLFPDTYFFSRHEEAVNVLKSFLQQFFFIIAENDPELVNDEKRLFEIVTLASIIEKEYRDPIEIKKIAGVFSNRLKIGMGLQSCATIVYITTELMGRPHTGFVTIEDTRIDSPYNTYLWAGLPPGPISNPGRLALDAAMHPARHGFLYFRLIDEVNGRHFFSKTLDEHAHAKKISVKR